MATLAIVAAAAGALVSAIGAEKAAQGQQNMANYQAQIASNNQKVAEQNARAAENAGEAQAEGSEMKTAQIEGDQRARLAAAGVDIGSGTPLLIQRDTADMGALDADTIRNNAARTAYGYRVQGVNYGAQAQLDILGGKNARMAGDFNAMSSIIGGASSVGDKYARYKQAGIY